MKGIIPQGKSWTRAAFAAHSDPEVEVLIPFFPFAHSEMEPSRWFRFSRSLGNKPAHFKEAHPLKNPSTGTSFFGEGENRHAREEAKRLK